MSLAAFVPTLIVCDPVVISNSLTVSKYPPALNSVVEVVFTKLKIGAKEVKSASTYDPSHTSDGAPLTSKSCSTLRFPLIAALPCTAKSLLNT